MKNKNKNVSRNDFFKEIFNSFGTFIEEVFGENLDALQKKFPLLIRPPGAAKEETFVKLCSKCGKCIRACPYIALQPVIHANEFDRGTPCLRVGNSYCRFCKDFPCIKACPTGALSLEGNTKFLGKAFGIAEKCLRTSQIDCTACEKICETIAQAISFPGENSSPEVNANRCIGCGACATVCPVTPERAINIKNV